MTRMPPNEVAARIGAGLLTFPVTHFHADLSFDEEGFRDHCAWLLEHPFAALFAAGGTGEFFSLTLAEVDKVVRAAVEVTDGRIPVIAGCGYGTSMAVEMARSAEIAGADGLLLLPPYLVKTSQEGLFRHISAICEATSLAVIVYARDNCVLEAETLARLCQNHENLVGYKDGLGDIESFTAIRYRLGDRLTYIGGLPTAETFAAPYLEMGCTTYSSAIANFAPTFACEFHRSIVQRDKVAIGAMLENFVLPYAAIRNRGAGYAVSIVKAGLQLVGRPAGPVRPPLQDLTSTDFQDLRTLVSEGLGQPVDLPMITTVASGA